MNIAELQAFLIQQMQGRQHGKTAAIKICEILEKQIPKKPNKAIATNWGIRKEINVCPVCNYYLGNYAFINTKDILEKHKVTYCETCGQAIDWNEVE